MRTKKIINCIKKQANLFRDVGKEDIAFGLDLAVKLLLAEKDRSLNPATKAARVERVRQALAVRMARVAERRAARATD